MISLKYQFHCHGWYLKLVSVPIWNGGFNMAIIRFQTSNMNWVAIQFKPIHCLYMYMYMSVSFENSQVKNKILPETKNLTLFKLNWSTCKHKCLQHTSNNKLQQWSRRCACLEHNRVITCMLHSNEETIPLVSSSDFWVGAEHNTHTYTHTSYVHRFTHKRETGIHV